MAKIGMILLLGAAALFLSKKSTAADPGQQILDPTLIPVEVTLSTGETGIKFLQPAGLSPGQSYQPDVQGSGSEASIYPSSSSITFPGASRYAYDIAGQTLYSNTGGVTKNFTLTDLGNLIGGAAGREILEGIHYNDTGFIHPGVIFNDVYLE